MKFNIRLSFKPVLCLFLVLLFLASCKTKEVATNPKEANKAAPTTPLKLGYKRVKVSWFESSFYKKAASTGRDSYTKDGFVAAHRTLPIGSVVEMINPNNNLRVQVKIVYRGPNVAGREFDLSKKAFKELEPLEIGLIYVDYKVIK